MGAGNPPTTLSLDGAPVEGVEEFSRAYAAAANFGVRYFGMDELITRSNISPPDYKTLYPLFVFDVTKQNEKLKTSTVDVQIKTIFNEACPAGTQE